MDSWIGDDAQLRSVALWQYHITDEANTVVSPRPSWKREAFARRVMKCARVRLATVLLLERYSWHMGQPFLETINRSLIRGRS